MEEILEQFSTNIRCRRAPFSSTAVRFELVGGGYFGVRREVNRFAEPVRDCGYPQTATCAAAYKWQQP